MNKILTLGIIAGGLLLVHSSQAAAHAEIRVAPAPAAYSSSHYRFEARQSRRMPAWLRSDPSFKRWYRHSRLQKNRHVSWRQLYRIYRREQMQRWTNRYPRKHAPGYARQRYVDRDERHRAK